MKKVLLFVYLCLITVIAYAVPAKPGPRVFTQPDGSEITIFVQGDETYHFVTDAQGTLLKLNDEGYYVSTGVKQTNENVKARRAKARIKRESKPRRIGASSMPARGLFILVSFSNATFKDASATYYKTSLGDATEGAMSMYNYLKLQSSGAYAPPIDVFGPVNVNKTYATYGANDSSDDDQDPAQMIVDACTALDSEIDFSQYDANNDGVVDNVYVIYAGKGEADGGAENTIWPHQWDLSSAGKSLKLDGKKIVSYACSAELNGSSKCAMGTPLHEFSHVLGLPDYYDTEYKSTNYTEARTPGDWSLMDAGSYLNDGNTPPNYSIFDKYFLGWATPTILNEAENVTLNADGSGRYITSDGKAAAATSTGTVYYLENRQQSGWDKYLPGHGMIVWQVKYNATNWDDNDLNNTGGSPRLTVVSASGNPKNIGKATDPFPGTGSVISYTPFAAYPLTEITESNKIITFKFMGGAVEVPEGKVLLTYDLEGVTKTSGPDAGTIDEGEAFTATFTATNGYYDIDSEHCLAEVTVGGNEVANAYTIAGGVLTVSLTAAQVTGPVVVTIYNTDKNPAKTDVLNYNFVGVSGTSYSAWTAKDGSASDAVYAGKSAGGNSSIQLRSTGNDCGIVSTTSGGKLKSITVKFNSSTSANRVLDVYASNTAYTSASDLYSSANQGTKVTSFTYSGAASSPARRAVAADDGLTYTFEDDYEYIGIRSNSGALYLDEVDIAWRVAAENPTAEADITFSPDAIEFTETLSSGVAQADKTLSVTGVNLADVILVDISSTSDVFSIDTDELASEGGEVVVTLNASAAGSYSAEITLLSVDANNNNVERKVQVSATVSEEGAPAPTYTVTWSVDGVETQEQVEETLSYVKAAPANCDNGRVFVGWTSQSSVSGEAPSDLFDATEGIAVNGDATYYAVFATASESQGGAGTSTTITIEDYASADGTFGDFIFTAGGSGTKAAYNTNGKDARYYAGNTLTIESATAMTSIVFNISTQGLKRLAAITADAGEIATQASGDATVTWTGSATSVTFTVGAQAEYGSDGSSKAGQLDFISVDITAAGSGSATTYSDYSLECEVAVEAPKTYVVAGNIEELGNWDLDSAPKMTVSGATATAVISDLVLTAGTHIEYKVVIRQEGQNDVWKGDAQNDDANYYIDIEDAGTYTLTFTYNIEDETAACAVERTDFADYTFNLVERPSDWTGTPNLFVWDDQNNSQNGGWPGAAMTADGNIYTSTVRVYGTQANIIFSNNGTPQTCDILDAKSGNYRVNSTVCENSEHLSADLVYKVNVSDYEGGSVIVNSWAAEGEEVQVEAYADNGYTLEELTVTYADNSSDVITSSFTMPAGDVTINATFVKDAVEVTVQWLDEGSPFHTETLNAGTPLGDPGEPAACESGKVFVGWTENVTLDGSKPADLFTFTDGLLAPEEDAVYNAVFANATQSQGGAGSSTTITIEDYASADGTFGDFIFTAGGSGTKAAYNTNGKDARYYAGNTLTIESATAMTSIVFNISTQGLKRLAPITADAGEIATQASGDATVTWTGSATSVTFTVGAQAEYGSDGSSKAGQLDFISVDITTAGSGNSTTYSDYSLECGEAAQTCTPIGISLDYSAAKVEYTIGEQFSTDGLVVELVYLEQECASEVVTGWTVTNAPDMTTEDVYTVEISYTVGEETFTETYDVAVYAPTTYTVTWSVDGTETTAEFNEGAALVLPTAPAACESGKVFVGWTAESQISGAPADLFTEAGNLTVTEDITYYAVFAVASESEGGSAVVVDQLTNATTGVSGSNYSSWTATGTSGAEYAGQSAGSNSSIQLRSNNSNSGIVVTKSAGNVTKVAVVWNNNTNGRTINIYGSNTAYTDPTELYGNSIVGELLGTIASDSGTELEISGEYAYIGIRSASGALYLDEVNITWGTTGGNATTYSDYSLECGEAPAPAASIVADPASVSFAEELVGGVVDGAQQTVTITAENLNTTYNEIDVSLKEGSDDEFTVSPDKLGISGGTITIQLDAIAAGNYEATIVVESLDADENVVSVEIPVTATVTDPTVVPTTYDVTVAATTNGTVTADPTSAVEGATVTLTVTPDEGYQLAALTVTDANDNTVTVSENTFTMPAANVTVTATFEQIPAVTTETYVLTDLADITSDDVVIITMTTSENATYALSSANGTSSAPTAIAVTVADNKIETTAENIYWNLNNSEGNLTIYVNGTTETWLYTTAANNGVRVGTNANSIWTVDETSGYLLNTATNRYLGVYNNQDWRAYTNYTGNTANQTLAFYVKQSSTTPKASITANPTSVSFAEELVGGVVDGAQQTVTITAENLNATYNEIDVSLKEGSDDEFTVSPDKLGISGGTITIQLDAIAAGNYTATIVVESLDADEQVVSIEIPVTATVTDPTVVPETYNVTVVPTDNGTVAANPTEAAEGETIALTLTPADGYQLASLSVVDANSTEIEVATDNTFVMPAANVTVTATFELIPVVPVDGAVYEKVTAAPNDWSGTYLIVYEDGGVAFNGGLETLDAVSNTIEVSISDSKIAVSEATAAAEFTIAAVDGGYSIQAASGKYIGHGSDANALTSSDNALVNTLSIEESGDVNILAAGGAYLRYNSASNQARFRYYKSSSYTSQKAIQLYKRVENTEEPDTKLYILGQVAGNDYTWAPNTGAEMSFSNGVYTITTRVADSENGISAGYLSFTTMLADNSDDWQAIASSRLMPEGSNNVTVEDGGTYGISAYNDVDRAFQFAAGTWTITVDLENSEMTATLVEAAKPVYYLVGYWSEVDQVASDNTKFVDGQLTYTFETEAYVYLTTAHGVNYYTAEFVSEGNTATFEQGNSEKFYVPAGTYDFELVENNDGSLTLSYVEQVVVAGKIYTLTTLDEIDGNDEVIITMTKEDGSTFALFSANGTSSAPTAVAVTVVDDKIQTNEANIYWNIVKDETDETQFSIHLPGDIDTWLYSTNANNGVRVGNNENKLWTIDETSGYLLHVGTSRYMGVYNSQDWRAYTSVNNNIANQTMQFFVRAIDGTDIGTAAETTSEEALIKLEGNVLVNLTGKAIGVYNVTGQRVVTVVERLDVRELPAGVYIISDGKNTLKLFTR